MNRGVTTTTVDTRFIAYPQPFNAWPIRDKSIWHPKTTGRSAMNRGVTGTTNPRPASEDDWLIRVRHPKTIGRSAINRGVTGTADPRPASEDDWQIRDKSRIYDHHRRSAIYRGSTGTQKARAPRHFGTPSILVIYFLRGWGMGGRVSGKILLHSVFDIRYSAVF
jgi:hypothetical protein